MEVYYSEAVASLINSTDKEKYVLTLTSQGCADAGLCYPPRQQYFEVDHSISSINETARPTQNIVATTDTGNTNQTTSITLWVAIIMAFAGGLILNLMPCVLPVLTLKVLSFSKQQDKTELRRQGWAYTAGVIISFVLVAALLIALKTSGQAIGWGFQLQATWFVGALVYLFFILGLAMFGTFELGSSFMGVGQSATEQGGIKGSFFTGVLATVVASPCTAPFMGTALGFAVSQHWAIALCVFAALGAGMAAPFLLLSYWPSLQRYLPKPGAWMEKFKQFTSFPLWATAIWLLSVLTAQSGSIGSAIVLTGCLLIALSMWYSGRGEKVIKPIMLVAALSLLASPNLNSSTTSQSYAQFNMDDLTALRQNGRPVLVNVTADWCITCKVNEELVLGTTEIKAAIKSYNIEYIVADWTTYNPEISKLLDKYQRTGIPLYLLYSKSPEKQAKVLPQILTKQGLLAELAAIK